MASARHPGSTGPSPRISVSSRLWEARTACARADSPKTGPGRPRWSPCADVSQHFIDDLVRRIAQQRDVGERIAVDDDEVGELALLDRAKFGFAAAAFGGPCGASLDRLHRRHAGLDEALQLAGIGGMTVTAGIGTGDNLD